MAPTALHDRLVASGGHAGEYCGAETASSFGDPRREFFTLLRGCGIYDLGWRAKLKITGKDRVRWLNGMVSNNIRELPAGRGVYNFLLNPQGHIQGDLYVYNRGDYFLAGTEQFQLERLLPLLRRYIIMDQVELTDITGELTAIGVQGPEARAVFGKAEFQGPLPQPMELGEIVWQGKPLLATRMANEKFETYEIWVAPADAPGLWNALMAAGAAPVGTDALEMFRVAAGIACYGVDIRDRDLPQETGQMQALSFTKGCYIGQEIVERIRSRGAVHRTFTGFVVDGPTPSPGAKLHAGDKEVGEITSALPVPTVDNGDRVLALGYIRREFSQPGSALQLQGASATVAQVPFAEVFSQTVSS